MTSTNDNIPEDAGSRYHKLASRYLELLLHKQAATAIMLLLNTVQDGLPLKELYLQILQPTQYELGRLWQTGQINVAEEHYCTAATQQVMTRLYPRIFSTPKNGRVLVATCVWGELHEIGLRMVADLFELEGWDTHFFSSNTPFDELKQALGDYHANLLAISATMSAHIPEVHKLVSRTHDALFPTPVKIMVGGYPFNADPELWRRIGADGTAQGALEAVQEGSRLCQD